MSTPQDPREQPLAGEEAELARVLRALPGGEPSARVDAAILRAATDAVAGQGGGQAPGRRRRLPTWALGTAAAAVLAVFVGVQLRPEMAPPLREITAEAPAEPAAAKAEAPSAPDAARDAARDARRDAAQDATPDTQALPAPAAYRVAPSPPPPPPPPAPEAPRASGFAAEAGEAADRATAQAAAEADSVPVILDEPSPADIAEPVPAPAPPLVVAPAAYPESPPVLPPVADDRLLAPEDWIARIRERLAAGDEAGARASLALLRREHPDLPLPPDLADLLK